MASDSDFTRRVCAVLLADVTGFSALMGEDDERTARAVQHLQTIVQGIVSEAKGYAEPKAGDAFFATFDSVVAAVDAALTIQRRMAVEEFAGTRLQMRIGVHFGDVLLREGAAFGDAINIAARLQALAKPGTICISEGVYRQVRNRFDEQFVDLGRQQLKNISDAVHAYLIVPDDLEYRPARRLRRPSLAWGLTGAAVLLIGMAAAVLLQRSRTAEAPPPAPPAAAPSTPAPQAAPFAAAGEAAMVRDPSSQVALGVMLFKSMGAEAGTDWRREALRDGLNTQLSQLSKVKVYSKEFLDFLITRKGLTEIEAASQLGIRKMLSGSFVASGGSLRIETHIVDVQSGVMEASYTTSGSEKDFLDLQNKLALGVISRLNLPVTDEEKKALLAQQNTNVEALKMLLEAESGGAPPKAPDPLSAPATHAPQSSLWGWIDKIGPVAAVAGETNGEQAAILDVLERYRRATEAGQLDAIAQLHAEFTPEQQAALQRYFDNVRDLHVVIDNVDIAVVGDEAVVSYTRTDDFADSRTGRPMHVAVRLTKTLRQEQGAWKLAGGK